MNRSALALAFVALVLPATAQMTGIPGVNDFTINGAGSGTTSCSTVFVPFGPSIVNFAGSVMPGDQVVMGFGTCAPGLLVINSAGDTLDIGLAGVVYDSAGVFGPGPSLPWGNANANSNGDWALSVPADMPAGNWGLQLGLFGPIHSDGVSTSQALDLTVSGLANVLCPQTVGNDLALSDDGNVNLALGATFSFYGVAYSDLYVNMNGNITFGGGDTDWSPSEADFLSGLPRIAPCWSDWTPSDPSQGTVRTFDDGTVFVCEWYDVRHFGTASCSGGSDRNTFCAMLTYATGDLQFLYDEMRLCPSIAATDQLVGVSPGLGLSSANNGDLWNAGPAAHFGTLAQDAVYEDFTQVGASPFDLGVTWGANVGIGISSSLGAGPYTATSF